MTELFNWSELLTVGGGAAATAFITGALKNLPGIKKLPTRILSMIIGVVLMETAYFFVNGFSVEGLIMQLFNGIAVAFSSNGAYDMVTGEIKKPKPENEENSEL